MRWLRRIPVVEGGGGGGGGGGDGVDAGFVDLLGMVCRHGE